MDALADFIELIAIWIAAFTLMIGGSLAAFWLIGHLLGVLL